jgi:hypothetical protein
LIDIQLIDIQLINTQVIDTHLINDQPCLTMQLRSCGNSGLALLNAYGASSNTSS